MTVNVCYITYHSNRNLNPSDFEELSNKANNCWFLDCAHGIVFQGEDNISGSCVCVCVCVCVCACVRDRVLVQ